MSRSVSVLLENVYFGYNKLATSNIIHNVSLSCNSSEIFAIVGPSGCGKTTLVKLIIAARKAEHGNVTLFGYNNCDDIRKYAQIPGPNLGYMPQDESLPSDFRVYDCLYFFAILCKMNISNIKQRIHEVLRDLDLFDKRSNFIWTLSGGMKRRLSLAIAIIHKPQLLVLDEPTVGADPLIRQKMWQLFNQIKSSGTTIILTTHYMNECKYSDKICFLRGGQVLAIDRLYSLVERFGSNNLDNVYMEVYQLKSPARKIIPSIEHTRQEITFETPKIGYKKTASSSFHIIFLLMYRYCHLFLFSPMSLGVLFNLPTLQVYLFYLNSMGLKNVPIGLTVENQSICNFQGQLQQLNITPKCIQCIYPSHFVDFVDKEKFAITYYDSLDKALEDVDKHKIWATIYINDRFVEAHFQKLTLDWSFLDEGIIKSSRINLYADTTNQFVFEAVDEFLADSYAKYWKSSAVNLGRKNPTTLPFELMNSVINNKRPEDEKGTDFLLISTFMSALLTASVLIAGDSMVCELKENLMERFLSVGLRHYHIFYTQLTVFTIFFTIMGIIGIAHIHILLHIQITAFLISPLVILISMVMVALLFGQLLAIISMNRTFTLIFAITFSNFLLFCQDSTFTQKAYPYFLSDSLRITPFYAPLKSFRSSILYGHDLSHPFVYLGHVCNLIYIPIYVFLVYYKIKSKG